MCFTTESARSERRGWVSKTESAITLKLYHSDGEEKCVVILRFWLVGRVFKKGKTINEELIGWSGIKLLRSRKTTNLWSVNIVCSIITLHSWKVKRVWLLNARAKEVYFWIFETFHPRSGTFHPTLRWKVSNWQNVYNALEITQDGIPELNPNGFLSSIPNCSW